MLNKIIDYFYLLRSLGYVLSGRVELVRVRMKNKKLAEEIEGECRARGGVLTYGEYAQIEQYGENGYHNNSDKNGLTDVKKRWPAALARYCSENKYNSIVEFGCGSGELGVLIVREYKKICDKKIYWTGVEINKNLHGKIRQNFKIGRVEDSLRGIVETIDGVSEKNKALVIFPYSLDSIPPEVFLNVSRRYAYPDSILGIRVREGYLSEKIISRSKLEEKGISFNDGLYSTVNGVKFDLRSWKLWRGQRAFVPIAGFGTLLDYAKKLPDGSAFLVVDEFRESPLNFYAGNLGKGRDLYAKGREYNNPGRYYKEAGEHICYYPIYKDSMYKFLHEIGFRSVRFDIEQKLAAELSGKKWVGLKQQYFTYAFIARNRVEKKSFLMRIVPGQRKLI